ncbi:hypothetical protein [Streptomyces virginiae]|uniref:hypothetical protein n=1 Tax=Streptomyces virginiae TaxID=1961 RepID=UPI003416C7CF
MDMRDVVDRSELYDELARRYGTVPEGRRRPRLPEHWQKAWTLFETACRFYGSTQPEELAAGLKRAHEEYTGPGARHSVGFLNFMFRHLAPAEAWGGDIPPGVEWAARSMEAVRAGLGNQEFARWISAIDEAFAVIASETELPGALVR